MDCRRSPRSFAPRFALPYRTTKGPQDAGPAQPLVLTNSRLLGVKVSLLI